MIETPITAENMRKCEQCGALYAWNPSHDVNWLCGTCAAEVIARVEAEDDAWWEEEIGWLPDDTD